LRELYLPRVVDNVGTMRIALLLSFVTVSVVAIGGQTQGTAPAPGATTPRPTTTQPAAPAQPRRAAPAPARGGMTITVTDPKGATLQGIHVQAAGPTDRQGDTDGSGRLNLPGLLAGTYRLTMSGPSVITFEREVTVRGGQVADVDISLNPAPEPPPPPPPPPQSEPAQSAKAPVGPKGQALTLGIVDLLDKEFIKREPRRESLLSCSGNERATMIQLNEPMPQRLYDDADAVYYVLGGEGSVALDGKSSRVTTNGFVSVPRGTPHSFERRGNRPLVLLAILSGEPCERPK
jgi:mannose-6-phosphate isomerase-like protein (cupin superfamily)